MSKPDLGVFVGKYARENIKKSLEMHLPTQYDRLTNSSEVLPEVFPKKLIVVGGDGTVRKAMEGSHRLEEPSAIGIVPGGTLNAFYQYLVEKGATASVDEFSETDGNNSRYSMFQPGIVNENGFILAAGFGGWEANYAFFHNNNLAIRSLPRDSQVKAASVASVIGMLKQSLRTRRPVLNCVFTIPKVGPIRVTGENEMSNGFLAHATMSGENQLQAIIKGALVLIFCHYTGTPLSDRANVTYLDTVCVPREHIPPTGISIDGDLVKIEAHDSVKISRSKKAVPVVALTL